MAISTGPFGNSTGVQAVVKFPRGVTVTGTKASCYCRCHAEGVFSPCRMAFFTGALPELPAIHPHARGICKNSVFLFPFCFLRSYNESYCSVQSNVFSSLKARGSVFLEYVHAYEFVLFLACNQNIHAKAQWLQKSSPKSACLQLCNASWGYMWLCQLA
jgi:hypothetical protein